MVATTIQKKKLVRLAFYLSLYLVPALLACLAPQGWLTQAAWFGLFPGLWRSLRRGQFDPQRCLLFSATTGVVSLLVAGVSHTLGWISIPFWVLVALEQAHRRQSNFGLSRSH